LPKWDPGRFAENEFSKDSLDKEPEMRWIKNLAPKKGGMPNEEDVPQMVRRYFAFLIEEYGLTDDGDLEFMSSKARIKLEIGHKSPRIVIYRVGEPEFSRLILERIIQYFEGRVEIDDLFISFPDHPLEHNISFIATLFKRYAQRIIEQIDEWWIPVQVFQYNLIKKEYEQAGQLEDFLFGFRDKTEYLKSKGAL
jgi:hypothetical protein